MRNWRFLPVALIVCAFGTARAAPDESTMWAYKYVLATATDFREIEPIMKQVDLEPELRTSELVDLLADLLATHKPSGSDEDVARTSLVRALIREGNPRYWTVLLRIANEKTDSDAVRFARTAMNGKKLPQEGQYRAGMSNVEALRDEYARAALAVVPTEEAALQLGRLSRGKPIAAVFETLGRPQSANTRFRRRIVDDIWGSHAYSRLSLYYRGLGRVQMQYYNGRGWLVYGVVVAPLAFEDYMPYRIDPAKYGQIDDNALAITQLVSSDRSAIRLMLDWSEQYDTASLELMDTAAERLLHEHAQVPQPLTRDLYNWMCVLLARDGGNRYANVLAMVASTTQDEKTREFALNKIDSTKNPDAPPYVPGTVSLEKQREKYPSLYPERIYVFGHP